MGDTRDELPGGRRARASRRSRAYPIGRRLRAGLALGALVGAHGCASEPPPLPATAACAATSARTPGVVRDAGDVLLLHWAGELGCLGPGDAADEAAVFMRLSAFEGASGHERWAALRALSLPDELGLVHLELQQMLYDVPVVGARVTLHVEAETRRVVGVSGQVVRADRPRPEAPVLSADQAVAALAGALGVDLAALEVLSAPKLAYVAAAGRAELAWRAVVHHVDPSAEEARTDEAYVGALRGEHLASYPLVRGAESEGVMKKALDGGGLDVEGGFWFLDWWRYELESFDTLWWSGTRTGDPVAKAVYENLGRVEGYYRDAHGRDSVDDGGEPLLALVHLTGSNAAWAAREGLLGFGGEPQGLLGFGDGVAGGPTFGEALDVVAHEVTHGVIHYSAGLVGYGESGALGEAIADLLAAAAVSSFDAGVIGDPDPWLVGEILGVGDPAIRSLRDPASVRRVVGGTPRAGIDHYSDLLGTEAGRAHVHLDAGVGGLAFYLMAQGGRHPRGRTSIDVPALGVERTASIVYRALTRYLSPHSDYEGARYATAAAASDLYGAEAVDAVHRAWDAVGVPGDVRSCLRRVEPDRADPCSRNATCSTCVRDGVCGWCWGRCVAGTVDGADDGTCQDGSLGWSYAPSECVGETGGPTVGDVTEGVGPTRPAPSPDDPTLACVGPTPPARRGAPARGGCSAALAEGTGGGGAAALILVLFVAATRRRQREGRVSSSSGRCAE